MVKLLFYSVLKMIQFDDQVKVRFNLQLIKGTSRIVQNLLKYSNGTAVSALIIRGSLPLPDILDLSLNDSESAISA